MKTMLDLNVPCTQYTKIGDVNIAYQVFGSGDVDLVYIPGWISNIEWMWACPELANFFKELGQVARVILFDKRGTGLSDRITEFATLEERMEDIKAVMDAVGSKKAILFGHSEGGSVSAMFSATYPNRVHALIAFGIFAKRRYCEAYPWAPTDQERQKVYDMIEHNWGSGEMNLESLAPSKAKDTEFMSWLGSYFRSGASPKAAMTLTKMNTQVNIIDILKYIKVPTLLMQRTNDIDVKIEEGRFIAERIKDAKLIEFDGDDHLFWAGNTQEVLSEIKTFINTLQPSPKDRKGICTILFGNVNTVSQIQHKCGMVLQHIHDCGGYLVSKTKKHFVAKFETPGKAVTCSTALRNILQDSKTSLTMGMFLTESCCRSKRSLNRKDEYMIDTIQSVLHYDQILATQSIMHLLTGSAYNFSENAAVLEYASSELCKLYSIQGVVSSDQVHKQQTQPSKLSQYNSFLEDVLQVIEEHLDNSRFGVEMLTQKIGVGERTLQRNIKEITGKSPSQLITSIRLNKAKSALNLRNYTIAEIAFQFGFSSPSYFSRCFKKEFGISPNEIYTN